MIDAIKPLPPEYLGLWFADRQSGVHIVHGKVSHRSHLTQFMDAGDRLNFAGIGKTEGAPCK